MKKFENYRIEQIPIKLWDEVGFDAQIHGMFNAIRNMLDDLASVVEALQKENEELRAEMKKLRAAKES